jgi:type I restriction enzyme, S subunit
MSIQSEAIRTPKLRFPEFSGDWEEKKLGNISDVSKLAGFEFTKYIKYKDNGNIIALRGLNIKMNKLDLTEVKFIDDSDFSKLNRSKLFINDLMFTYIGTIGEVALIDENDKYYLAPNVSRIRFNKEICLPKFAIQYFNRDVFKQSEIWKYATASSQLALTMGNVRKFSLNLPTKPEQQKIATFLTSVDTKIEKLIKKQELLGKYKKGLMQQIFSQAIRFKADDGSDYPHWEEKEFGDIGQTFNGLTGKTKDDFGRGKPYIQYMQIFESSKINIDNFGLVDVHDDENQKVAQYGDVFFTTSSETPDAVGYSSVLLDDIDELYLNSFCFGFRPNSLDELTPNFAQFLLRSANFRRRVVRLAQGSTRYNMSKVQLMKEVVGIPSLEEQTKIANFLSSIDSKIEQIGKQLDETKHFKKALLQQMFV